MNNITNYWLYYPPRQQCQRQPLHLPFPSRKRFHRTGGNRQWLNEDGELRYKDSGGYYLTDSWKEDGEWYYLNEDGFISPFRQD